ncbi:MAG: transglutaminase [Devosia sp.]|nr:transglutaminase [Devosia sp.]
MHRNTKAVIAALLSLAIGLAAVPAQAFDLTNIAYVQTAAGGASIPVGHAEFCATRPAECQPNAEVVAAMPLTPDLWQQLLNVNTLINTTVVPVTDEDLYQVAEFWTYPNGYGDCEDFALAKRRVLIEAGWPASTLLITVVRETNGNGHAVLTVRTDRGDLVLDNQNGDVRLWSDTPYQFIKRQAQDKPARWVDMIDTRLVVASTN